MKLISRTLQPFFWLAFMANTLHAQVSANFSGSPLTGCSPLIVNFTDLSSGNPTSWFWDLGNGNTSTAQNPSAIYVTPGLYSISLTVSDGTNNSSISKSSYIQVFNNPVADFSISAQSGCIPFTTSFTDLSSSTDGTINTWTWDFGDGTTSSLSNPTHTYNSTGTFSVSLVVQDDNGCQDDTLFSNLITVDYPPVAGFTMSGNYSCYQPFTVNFSNTSSGNITSYAWDFGDGNSSSLSSPSHTYSSFGTFPVELIVTTNFGCTDIFRDTIVIEPFVAAFTSNLTQICQGDAVQFNNFSGPNANSWQWDFGDGATSSSANPLHVYNSAGDFTVTLIASGNGCPDTVIKVNLIHVQPYPLIDFFTLDTFSCSLPYTVSFTNQTVNGVNWFWDFGDGSSSNAQNPVQTYTTEGSFSVSLTATGSNGCPAVLTKSYYVVVDVPVADFYAFPINHGCIPLPVLFNDSSQSTDPIVSWQWDFGDGSTSTLQNPMHVYNVPGTYNVSLIITTAGGCIDTVIRPAYIQVGTPPLPAFTWAPDTQCVHQNVNFFDASSNTLSWQWDFGDGSTDTARNPVHAYADTGTYTITLTVSNMGCDSVLVIPKIITIIGPVAQFTDSINCLTPLTVLFTDQTINPHQSWWWDFGDGAVDSIPNPVHNYAAFGTYNVMLIVTDSLTGCPDTFRNDVVIPNLSIGFNGIPLSGCGPLSVDFTNLSVDGTNYLWDFGDGTSDTLASPSHVYTASGLYSVSLHVWDINGCEDSLTMPNYIEVTDITAGFTGTNLSGCLPLNVNFQDTSTSSSGIITNWLWNFGDGLTSILQNPIHVYSNPGYFNVQLTVWDNNGCNSTSMKPAYVYVAQPAASILVDSIACLGDLVQFTSLSTGDALSYLWNFGDGNTSNQQHPLHAYMAYGLYSVSLTVTDSFGCSDSIVLPKRISVQQLIAGFSAAPTNAACPPLTVYFTDTSSGNISTWNWDFGDGTSSALQNPAHTYTAPGIYSVRLIASTNSSCSDTFTINNLINLGGPQGTFTFSPDQGCIPLTTTLIASSPNTTSYTWDFGDGTIIFNGNDTIQHTYYDTGYHYPILIIDDGLGCTRSIVADSPIVADMMVADFVASAENICTAGNITFAPIIQSISPPVSYFWDFGDGMVSAANTPTHYYSNPGYYNVMLIVQSAVGCTDTIVKPQFIHVVSVHAAFTCDSMGCGIPFTSQFTDQSSSNESIIGYNWNFGDGSQSGLINPAHIYSNTGYFNAVLQVQTQSGCVDSHTVQMILGNQPLAAFQAADVCLKDSVHFLDNSSLTTGTITSWTWEFGDGSMSSLQNPDHLYQVDSSFAVGLVVTTDMGCMDTAFQTLTINPLPDPMATGDTSICIGQSTFLQANNGINYQWSPAASLNDASLAQPLASPLSNMQYIVLVSDANGCSNTDTVNVIVNPLPQPVLSPDQSICFGDSAQLFASGGAQYLWGTAQSLGCTSCPDPMANPLSTTSYTVTVMDINGCSAFDSVTLTVLSLPDINLGSDTLLCFGDTIIMNSNSNGVAYQWSPATNLSCATCPSTSAFPNVSTVYAFQVTSLNGCINHDTINVSVSSIPIAQAGDDKIICAGEQVQLSASGGSMYHWTPAASLSCVNCPNPIASPALSTQYHVNVSNGNCASTDSVFVAVKNKVTATAGPDTSICIGSDLQLFAFADSSSNGQAQYSWTPATTLSDANISNPIAVPAQSTIYTLTVNNGLCQPAIETVQVQVNNLPVVDAGQDQVIFTGMSAPLNATVLGTAPINYYWTPASGLSCTNCEDPVASPPATTVYMLTGTDNNGCRMKDSVTVNVIDGCAEALIFVPNTFTPNGDGRNDKLFVRAFGIQSINFFRVFDRWGKMVFETTDINTGWDGTHLGIPLDPGVFVYEVQGVCLNNEIFVKSGNVSIVK